MTTILTILIEHNHESECGNVFGRVKLSNYDVRAGFLVEILFEKATVSSSTLLADYLDSLCEPIPQVFT